MDGSAMETVGALIRWSHLLGATLLVGVFAFLVLVARPAARTADPRAQDLLAPLDRHLRALGAWALLLTLATGLLDLWRQTAVATGLGFGGSLSVESLRAVLFETRYGAVWLVRHAVMLLVAMVAGLADQESDATDWWALRLELAGLGALSLAVTGAAGHAASAQQIPVAAIAVDAGHLLATGVWFGGLLPLVVCLRWAGTVPDPTGGRLAAAVVARFSAVGLASVVTLGLTGAVTAWVQVGSFPALFGTGYGRWLLLKLALVLLLTVTAAVNLLVLRPRLLRAATAGGPAGTLLAQLRWTVLGELGLGAAILGVVGILGLTTPGRHALIAWPFTVRVAWDVTWALPGVRAQVAWGAALASLGVLVSVAAAILGRRRWGPIVAVGGGALVAGFAVALPPLTVDAYPTTYVRPAVPYGASSIAGGRRLYQAHCAVCHGVGGAGDGPAAAGLQPRPADLTAPHTGQHTAGDLFWWLTHGIRGTSMPGFGDRLSVEDRWDLINFLRALASADQARGLGPVVDPIPAIVAPDVMFTTGVGEGRSLRDARGRELVLVFFTLPDSSSRLTDLARLYPAIRERGGDVLGIPLRGARQVYRALGDAPVFFPIAVDGAEEAVAAYGLFRRDLSAEGQEADPPLPWHLELLVDRQGYLRARWIPDGATGWADPARLLAAVEELARETPRAPAPEEHVH
jgi:putative copper resistance protein D